MATPIFIPTSSGSGSSQDPTYATKAQLTTAVSSVNATISSATTALAINQKSLDGYAPSAGGIVVATDTIRSAIGKLANNTLPASIISNPLTGFSATTGTITSADTILSGISKNAGNISAQSATSIQTLTNKTFGDTLTANAGVLVKGTANQIKVYPTTDNTETSMVFNNLSVGATGGTGWILGQNIFGIGTGTFGIGGGTAGVVLQASPTTGLLTIPKTIVFPGAEVRKRISFFDDGDATSQTDHRFNGFGKGNFTHVYQIKSTAESHVFYVATSATTSNEIFRIAGTGAVSCGGTLASGSHAITGALTASTTANITGLATVGSLASTGNATVGGTLTVSGLLSAGGGLQLLGGNLTYYSEYDMTTTFTGAFTTTNIIIKLTRVGRKVSMDIQTDYSQSGGTANVLTSSLAIPSAYRPTAVSGFARGIHSGTVNSVFAVGNTYVLASGFITITGGSDSTNFTTTGVNGFQSHSLTWMV
jgi:hypothetical protein